MASEEVMVAQNQGIGQKITQVAILLQTQKEAIITAINLAIPAAVNLVEIIKHKVKGLHQINTFEKVQDSNKTRLKIKLSFNPLDTANKGYQAPLPFDQVQEKSLEDLKKMPVRSQDERPNTSRPYRRARGRGQSSYKPREATEETTKNPEDTETYSNRRTRRGRGRGNYRGRGSRAPNTYDSENRKSEPGQYGRGDRRGNRRGDRGSDRRTGWVDRRPRGYKTSNSDNVASNPEPPKHIPAGDPWGGV